MPRWRKATWALLVWTILMIVWGVSGAAAVSSSTNCTGLTGDSLSACQAGTAIGGGIGLTLIFFVWFVGFIILSLIWFMSRPHSNVVVFGPQGQQVTVTEKEARKRVETQGWTYQKPGPN